MPTRADWHVDIDVPDGGDDPLASLADPEQDGLPIDLDAEPRLRLQLVDLCNLESSLYNRNVRCPIKECSDTTCSACPIRSEDPAHERSQLCRVGVGQERVQTELKVIRLGGTG